MAKRIGLLMGGDRNIFFHREGRPIRRSSNILVQGASVPGSECYTAHDIFRALETEDAVVIAHVGGRYADITYAHDGRLERTVEVHSTWGTFEWLLHDAFDQGFRVGVVCHSTLPCASPATRLCAFAASGTPKETVSLLLVTRHVTAPDRSTHAAAPLLATTSRSPSQIPAEITKPTFAVPTTRPVSMSMA